MKRFRRLLVRTVLVVAALLVLALLATGWWGSGHMVSPQRRVLQDYHRAILAAPDEHGLEIRSYTGPDATPCLFVTASSHPGEAKKSRLLRDELTRRGVALPPWAPETGTVILLHGHQGRKEDHLPICERFCAAGFRCILPDIPAQGDNPMPCATFGCFEAQWTERLLDDAATRFTFPARPAFLFGVSQGGAIALQAAACTPAKWSGVASIATFASLDRPVLSSTKELLPRPLHFLAPLGAASVSCGVRLRAGFWPSQVRPVDAAARLRMPVFIGHGDLDPYIGIDQAREIFAALPAAKKRFRVIVGADHNNVLGKEPNVLYADICQFFLEALAPAPGPPPRGE